MWALSSQACERVYLLVFTAELLVKVVAYGFLFHEEAYLRDSWCQLDFLVVTLAWLPIIYPGFGNCARTAHDERRLRPALSSTRACAGPHAPHCSS